MWGVVYQLLSDHLGYTVDEIHELLKIMFLSRWLLIKDKKHRTTQSTTELSTSEMGEYLYKIRRWASLDLGMNIPEPNEVDYE